MTNQASTACIPLDRYLVTGWRQMTGEHISAKITANPALKMSPALLAEDLLPHLLLLDNDFKRITELWT